MGTPTYCSENLGCGYKRGMAYGCGQKYGSAFNQGPAGVAVKRNPYPYVPAGYEAEGDYNWQGTIHDHPSDHSRPVGRYNWTFNDFKYSKNGILDVNGRKGYAKFYECREKDAQTARIRPAPSFKTFSTELERTTARIATLITLPAKDT